MFCKNCGTSIDKSAKFCPSCGAPIEADSMPNIKNKTARPAEVTEKRKPSLSLAKKLWVGVAILIVGLICIAALTSNNPDGIENTSLGQTETVSDDIIIKCAQNEVSKILTSSSTARWGAAQILNHDGFGRYLVYVPLEAQNGFGGYGKLYYLVIVQDVQADGHYTVLQYGSRLEIPNFTNASTPTTVSNYINGEVSANVQEFLENNSWGVNSDASEEASESDSSAE